MTTITDYVKEAKSFLVVPDENIEGYLMTLIASEAGEFIGVVGKGLRGDTDMFETSQRMKAELGDLCFGLFLLIDRMGWSLEEILTGNLEKLRDRKARGVIKGNGDNR